MTERPGIQSSGAQTFPRVSVLGFVAFAIWIALAGGIVILMWGETTGWLAVALGLAIAALFGSGRLERVIEELGTSRSYPARAFVVNALLIGLVGFFAFRYATDPFVAYNKRDMMTLIHFAVAEVIAIGGLVANLVAYQRDKR